MTDTPRPDRPKLSLFRKNAPPAEQAPPPPAPPAAAPPRPHAA